MEFNEVIYIDGVKHNCTPNVNGRFYAQRADDDNATVSQHSLIGKYSCRFSIGQLVKMSGHWYSKYPDPITK